MVYRIRFAHPHLVGVALLIATLTLSACQSGDDSAAVQDITPPGAATPLAGQAALPTPSPGRTAKPEGTPAAGSPNVDVSPTEVTLGNVVLTFTLQPAQSVFDPGRAASGSAGGEEQKPGAPQKGYAVLGGSTLKVTNNFDAAQNPPPDQPREMLRHVMVQVRDKASGQLIPYISVSMDLLRDGRPALQDQPLVPMIPAGGGNIAQMHYGNNVKFPGRGEYQVFVRMESSPLLGAGSAGVAQFNISIR